MHGPPLTPQEAVASVARQVRCLEAAGLDRDQAIRRTAAETGIEPQKVRWCAESAPGGPGAHPSESGHGGDRARRQHPIDSRTGTTLRTAPGSRRRRPRAPLALAAGALVAGLLALASPASAAGKTLNVNPVTGNDTNSGTATKPLRTLTKALTLARSGDTVKLAAGGYGPGASGDQFPQSGLPVPTGVTIEGAFDNGFPSATLLGPGGGAGLNLAGNATVRNLTWGGQGFGIGLYAKQGTQTLSNLFIGMPAGASANVDGFTLDGGVFLRGSAQATLTGSTIFLLSGDATGVKVNEQARLTMDGGTITGGDQPNCRTGAFGIVLNHAAQATLTNINAPGFRNLAGSALTMTGTSKATLSNSLIERAPLPAGCAPRPSVTVSGSAALTTQRPLSFVQRTPPDGSKVGVGIQMGSSGPLKLQASIGGYDRGLQVVAGGTGSLTLDRVSMSSCRVCVDARGATGPISIVDSFLTAGSRLDAPSVGLMAPRFKMRNTLVASNDTGILVSGPGADLGTASDPGNNTIRNNLITGVHIGDTVTSSLVLAEGNTWEANTQGADATGRYPKPLLVNGLSPLAAGRNFDVRQFFAGADARRIQLGPAAAVGTFRLGPRTLTARPGRPASWSLAWTHPLGWKRLDRVVLRLDSRGKPVGGIVLDQQTHRLRASGPAVRLVAGRSTVAGGGKRLTARLTLRIAKRYAGRTLVAKLAARDDNGTRQGWRKAGRLRVLDD